jgi:hypothetical protein
MTSAPNNESANSSLSYASVPQTKQQPQPIEKSLPPLKTAKATKTSQKQMTSLLDSEGGDGDGESLPYISSVDKMAPAIAKQATNVVTADKPPKLIPEAVNSSLKCLKT